MRKHGDLVAVAFMLCLLSLGYLAVRGMDSAVVLDDAFYALPALEHQGGDWSLDYAFAEADPDGDAFPYVGTITDSGFHTRFRNPAWHYAGSFGRSIAGTLGHRVVVLAGVGAAAIAAGLLARRIGSRRSGLIAVGLAATSPLVFQGLTLWAHVVAAGGIGIAMIGVLDLGNESRPWVRSAGLLCAGATLATLVRYDGALFALAVAVTVAGEGLYRRRRPQMMAGAVCGVLVLAVHFGSGVVAPAIIGSSTRGNTSEIRGTLSGKVDGFVNTFVSAPVLVGYPLLAVSLIAVVASVWCLRRGRLTPAAVAIVIATVSLVLRAMLFPHIPLSGLIGGWPVVLLLAAFPRTRVSPDVYRIFAVLAVGAVGVAATQYDRGGGVVMWGGRFLTCAIPGLAALLAIQLDTFASWGREYRRFVAAVGALAVVAGVTSVAWDSNERGRNEEYVAPIEDLAPEVPVVVPSNGVPRMAWRTYGEIDWLMVPTDEDGGVGRLIEVLNNAGVDQVIAYYVTEDDLVALMGEDIAEYRPDVPVLVDLE